MQLSYIYSKSQIISNFRFKLLFYARFFIDF